MKTRPCARYSLGLFLYLLCSRPKSVAAPSSAALVRAPALPPGPEGSCPIGPMATSCPFP